MTSWIYINALVIGLSCSLAGVFLVIRHKAMLTDAISHAVLPGLVLAFLLTGSRNTSAMLTGAFVFGILCIVLIDWLRDRLRIADDASTGIVFTSLFALGIILVSRYAGQTDLDQECVLHGELLLSAFRRIHFLGLNIPSTFLTGTFTLLGVLIVLFAAYRPFLLTSFQPQYAATMGFSIAAWNYVVTAMASAVTVISFEAVGAILVIALMVVPAATAWIISKRLPELLWKTALISIIGSIVGVTYGMYANISIAGSIAFTLGVIFLITALIKKKIGAVSMKKQHQSAM